MSDGFVFAKEDTGNLTPLFFASLVEQEAHKISVSVTSNPVEGGGYVADNAIVMPDVIIMTAIVTNAKIRESDQEGDEVVASTLQDIERVARKKQLLTVVTDWKVYENMIIKNVDSNNSSTERGIIRYTVAFQEVTQATAQFEELRKTPVQNGEGARVGSDKTTPGKKEEGWKPTEKKSLIVQYGDGDIGLGGYLAKGFGAGLPF